MKKSIIIMVLEVIILGVSILATYSYTIRKSIIDKEFLYGTYSISETVSVDSGQRLAIVPEEDRNLNKGSFILYSQEDNTKLEGEWEWTDVGLLCLRYNDETIGIFEYLQGNYIFIDNENLVYVVNRISEYAITD